MSKFVQKTSGKCKLFALITALLLVAGLVMGIVFGFNQPATVSDAKTLTVQMNSYAGDTVTLEKLENVADKAIADAGLVAEYHADGELASGNIYEIVYTFAKDTDSAKLAAAKDAIMAARGEGDFKGAFIQAMVNDGDAVSALSEGFVWRGILAAFVVLVFVFVYTALRHKLVAATLVTGTAFLVLLLTTAIAALCRIPVTATFAYAAMFATLFGAAVSIVFVGTVLKAKKADENAKKDFETVLFEEAPVKSVTVLTAAMAVAFLLIGLISTTAVQWFAVTALIAMAASAFVTLCLLPGFFLPIQKKTEEAAARKARYDYKKNEEK